MVGSLPNIHRAILGTLLLIPWMTTAAAAQTVFYPGTFDPFHQTHWEELHRATLLKSARNAIVLPIDQAYYAEAAGKKFPKLFPFILKLRLTKMALDSMDVNSMVLPDLRRIERDVFKEILEVYKKSSDQEKYLLVGTDVLQTWLRLPGFEDFLSQTRIIVSTDPNDATGLEVLRRRFLGNERIEFVSFELAGLRAVDVKRAILADLPQARGMLPQSTYQYLEQNPDVVRLLGTRLINGLEQFFTEQVVETILTQQWPQEVQNNVIRTLRSDFNLVKEFYLANPDPDQANRIATRLKFPQQNATVLADSLALQLRRADFRGIVERAQKSLQLLNEIPREQILFTGEGKVCSVIREGAIEQLGL